MKNEDIDTYLNKKLDNKTIRLIYTNNKITPELSHKYKFLFNFIAYHIYETYLGSDLINDDDTKKSHFGWCWNLFFNKYKKNFNFLNNDKVKENLFSYFNTSFYSSFDKTANRLTEEGVYNNILSSIDSIFTLNSYKTKYYIDELLNIHESINFG